MRRILYLLCAAGSVPACSSVEDAAASSRAAPDYNPTIRPLGWSADDERVLFVHSELSGDLGNFPEFRCGGSGVYETDGRSPPRPVATGDPWCEHGAELLADYSLSADRRTVYLLPEFNIHGCSVIPAFDLAGGRWREAARICGTRLNQPALSPDGQRIAAVLREVVAGGGNLPRGAPAGRVHHDEERLTVMNADGSAQRVVGEPGDRRPVWSPDGRSLAVAPAGEPSIVIIDLDSDVRRVVTRGTAPAWSPDGQWLAFTRNPPGPGVPLSLYVIRADGTGERTVFTQDRDDMRGGDPELYPDGWPASPLWSPDGRRIVFTKHFQTGNTLWIVNADGTGLRLLSERIEPGA